MGELRVVVIGQESAGVQTVRLVARLGHRLVAALTDPGRERTRATSVAAAAGDLGAPVRDASLVRDSELASWLRAERVDLLLNVHSLHIVHRDVVAAPRIGSFNLHPGPLPRYPGLNAPSWAIYEGALTYGCTLHWMDDGVDTGDVAYEQTFAVSPDDTGLTLAARCVREGMPLVERLLLAAADGRADAIPMMPQEGERLGRTSGPPHEGRVPWTLSAAAIHAFVRACDYGPFASPWGHARATLDGADVEILRTAPESAPAPTRAEPGEVVFLDDRDAVVATGAGLIRVTRIRRGSTVVDAAEAISAGACFSA